MIDTIILVAILVGVAVGVAFIFRFVQKQETQKEGDRTLILLQKMSEAVSKDLLEFRRDFSSNIKEVRESSEKTSSTLHTQVKDFTKDITEMKSALEKVNDSVKNSADKMVNFQDIFKIPQLRGDWGESFLEDILKGRYPEEFILRQYQIPNSNERVDFALQLPNDLKLPIDSKFTRVNFEGFMTGLTDQEKTIKRKELAQAVKREIDRISEKYIRPEEGTTEYALMFIPAEAVYYEIMINVPELKIQEYANQKSVILTSPNTLYMTLQVIQNWFRDVKIHKETRDLIKRLATIRADGKKLDEGFIRLGKHLFSAQSSFEDSRERLTLLTGRVGKVVDKIIKTGTEENTAEKALPSSEETTGQ